MRLDGKKVAFRYLSVCGNITMNRSRIVNKTQRKDRWNNHHIHMRGQISSGYQKAVANTRIIDNLRHVKHESSAPWARIKKKGKMANKMMKFVPWSSASGASN